jgi:hypothetical protein
MLPTCVCSCEDLATVPDAGQREIWPFTLFSLVVELVLGEFFLECKGDFAVITAVGTQIELFKMVDEVTREGGVVLVLCWAYAALKIEFFPVWERLGIGLIADIGRRVEIKTAGITIRDFVFFSAWEGAVVLGSGLSWGR